MKILHQVDEEGINEKARIFIGDYLGTLSKPEETEKLISKSNLDSKKFRSDYLARIKAGVPDKTVDNLQDIETIISKDKPNNIL